MSERYELKGKIGEGGIGTVHKAIDNQLKREVAIKRLIPVEGEKSAEASENLLKEATTLSALQHPNIVTVYDVGTDEKGGFVVMELLKGETFDETIARGALTFDDFKNVVTQTLEALIAAHHVGLIHRDLKPSNLMVNWMPSGKFQIKILDFGLAKFSKQPSVQTIDQGDAILGSIYFMAPEQFERIALDVRTDLYSMGCMYYQCLTGKYPFDGENAPQVMASHLQNRVTPLHQLRPDVPAWACDWVMWLINRKMEDRPESAKTAYEQFQGERSSPAHEAERAAAAATAQQQAAPPFPGRVTADHPATDRRGQHATRCRAAAATASSRCGPADARRARRTRPGFARPQARISSLGDDHHPGAARHRHHHGRHEIWRTRRGQEERGAVRQTPRTDRRRANPRGQPRHGRCRGRLHAQTQDQQRHRRERIPHPRGTRRRRDRRRDHR